MKVVIQEMTTIMTHMTVHPVLSGDGVTIAPYSIPVAHNVNIHDIKK